MMSKVKNRKLSANPEALKIFANCIRQNLPDKRIQQILAEECRYRWTLDTIGRRRRAMGMIKKPGKRINIEVLDSPILTSPSPGLSDTEKSRWFRNQFKKTHIYQTLRRQFSPEEIVAYIEDFGLLCCQFEDIVVSEFMQIDDFIKHRLLIDQQLILKYELQKQVDDLHMWFIANPKKEEEDKDAIRLRIGQQRQLDDKYRYLKGISDRYDALAKERAKIYSSLAATRRDRLDELKGGKETFLELVAKLQHSQSERDKQGRYAELTRLSSEDIKNEFRKPIEFPDGSIEPIIMDSQTSFDDVEKT